MGIPRPSPVRIVPFISKNWTTARGRARIPSLLVDNPIGARYSTKSMGKSGLAQFLDIMLKPDNIPIVGLLLLVFFFTWVAFREARKNDQLIEEGRRDEILKEMQE